MSAQPHPAITRLRASRLRLDAAARDVVHHLIGLAAGDPECWHSEATIAEGVGLPRSTVHRAITRLLAEGVIREGPRRGPRGVRVLVLDWSGTGPGLVRDWSGTGARLVRDWSGTGPVHPLSPGVMSPDGTGRDGNLSVSPTEGAHVGGGDLLDLDPGAWVLRVEWEHLTHCPQCGAEPDRGCVGDADDWPMGDGGWTWVHAARAAAWWGGDRAQVLDLDGTAPPAPCGPDDPF